jgi:DNA (cytosine-5)-methyltransferase 1
MKSSNPYSGIYEAQTTRTLDNNGGNPACNQGGMAVVQGFDGYNIAETGNITKTITSGRNDTHNLPIVLEGNGSRESHRGNGYKESETMYTLNTVEQHAVCTYQKVTGTLNPGAHAGSYNGQDAYNDMLVVSAKQPKESKDFIVYGLDRASFNQGQNAQFDFSVEEEKAQTLVSKGPGGGTSETIDALCARDYKGVGSQYVDEGKCIVCYSRSSDTEN